MNGKLKTINSIAFLFLSFLLLICVSFAWFTSNKTTSVGEIVGTSESSIITIGQSMLFSKKEDGRPLPVENENKHITGLLDGDSFYYGISIISKDSFQNKTVNIRIENVDGGDFFIHYDGTVSNYNMCDVYTVGLDEVWTNNNKQTLTEVQQAEKKFARGYGYKTIPNYYLLQDFDLSAEAEDVITFVFKLNFIVSANLPDTISSNQAGNKSLIFDNIIVSLI